MINLSRISLKTFSPCPYILFEKLLTYMKIKTTNRDESKTNKKILRIR
jgi:hypothetical protein